MTLLPSKKGIPIRGTGCCCAAGRKVAEVWQSVLNKNVSCTQVPPSLFSTHLSFPVFTIDSWSPGQHVQELYKHNFFTGPFIDTNRTLLLTLTAVHEALESAGISRKDFVGKRVGIALGTTVGCLFNDEEYFIQWRDGLRPETKPVYDFLSTHLSLFIQQALDVHGPVSVVTNACASGTDAIGLAAKWLENDLCDMAIAGGADELSRIAYHGFACLMLMSDTPCRPFDQDRKGLNLGEGAGIVLLEKQMGTKQKQFGWIRGYASASDAYHPTAPHPGGRGLVQSVTLAMQDAGVTSTDIHLINCHGTGTKANDMAETNALAELGFSKIHCPAVSTKGITGHTLGAAGAIETILTLQTLRHGITPGTIGCTAIDKTLSFQVLLENDSVTLNGPIGLNQSLAFGGSNSALILEADKS